MAGNTETAAACRDPSGPAMDRRELVDHLLAVGATALAGIFLTGAGAAVAASGSAPQAEVRRKCRYGMVIDTRRCVGCRACMVACKAENSTPPGVFCTVVFDQVVEPRIDDKPLYMTKPCFHCEHPPCVDVCPVSATCKREQDGIVVIDYDRCIGCRYCMTACPYSARWFDFGENYPATETGPLTGLPSPEYGQFRRREHERSPIGNVRKCTFCLHLQDSEGRYDRTAGRWPACARTCTGHAIHFGDFNDPDGYVSRFVRERTPIRLKEELDTRPNVYYLV
jgi:molybdopterin-containing oxidoreductase family iron-sulfur binding subunit